MSTIPLHIHRWNTHQAPDKTRLGLYKFLMPVVYRSARDHLALCCRVATGLLFQINGLKRGVGDTNHQTTVELQTEPVGPGPVTTQLPEHLTSGNRRQVNQPKVRLKFYINTCEYFFLFKPKTKTCLTKVQDLICMTNCQQKNIWKCICSNTGSNMTFNW